MTDKTPCRVDVAVIGAGPAGCSTALWLSEMGFSVALVDKSNRLLARLADLQLPQNWVLGAPYALTSDLAQQYAAHIQRQSRIRIVLNSALVQARRSGSAGWALVTQTGQVIEARAVVVATGLRPLTFEACSGPELPLNAQELAHQRERLPAGRFLLLGGGDNAVENAVYLTRAGHAVTLWSRSLLRAEHHLLAQLEDLPPDRLMARIAQPLPERLISLPGRHDGAGAWQADSAAYGTESFDHVAVLFGNSPDEAALDLFAQAAGSKDALPEMGVFAAGDLSGRWHPCISTAIADGVETARKVQHWFEREAACPTFPKVLTETPVSDIGLQSLGATPNKPARAGAPGFGMDCEAQSAAIPGGIASICNEAGHPNPGCASRERLVQRCLSFKGLRFKAALGILRRERDAPQPIQVDAELSLGQQPLNLREDAITRVLDYRKVRQIIIDECTAEHVNLLETLVGKLCARLLQLPGVQGVRVKITKLEIFDDCEVAIRMEAGSW